jgi:NADPH:quinone reductase-like Zn-dependent oxidoreductase
MCIIHIFEELAMKAAVVRAPAQTPQYSEFDDPRPEAGETLVAVAASALSQITRGRASGAHYSSQGQFPFVAGIDGVGRREDGSRVYFMLPRAPFGGMAERTVVPFENCVALSDGLDDATAAALANPGMSSWAAFTERALLQAGETVLVNGATGASGRLAVQIAKQLGAKKVIATGRNVEALQTLIGLGADAVIPLGDEALDQQFLAQFAEGVDVVLDYLWGASAQRLLVAAAKAGRGARPMRFVQVGAIGGADISLPGAVLRSSAITLMGSGIGSIAFDRLVACVRELMGAAVPAGLKIATQTVPLAEVARGWTLDEGARVVFMP